MPRSPEVPSGFGGDAKPCLGTPAVLALLVISVCVWEDKNSFDKAASLELPPTWQRQPFRRAGLGCPRESRACASFAAWIPQLPNKSKPSAEPEGSRAPRSWLCALPSLPLEQRQHRVSQSTLMPC